MNVRSIVRAFGKLTIWAGMITVTASRSIPPTNSTTNSKAGYGRLIGLASSVIG